MFRKIVRCLTWMILCISVFSCQEQKELYAPPSIHFAEENLIFSVKVGKELVILPEIENDIESEYSWTTSDGKLLGSDKILKYTWNESDEIYVNFKVVTPYGIAEEELLVVVAALAPPIISMPLPEEGFFVLKQGDEISLEPTVTNGEMAVYEWWVNGELAGKEDQLVFKGITPGCSTIKLVVHNEDGKDEMEFDIDVKEMSDLSFSWTFAPEYHVSKGRELYISPIDMENALDAEFTWKEEGSVRQKGEQPAYVFTAKEEGQFHLSVTMDNSYTRETENIVVTVCPEEGRYKREILSTSRAGMSEVFEYLPAPGQFINETEPQKKIETMEEACREAYERLSNQRYVSLGAFGGYIVVGFDHSVENEGGYDLQIGGNAFDGGSEPGIVYVMQDENGDGKPNDNWYELKGSEYGKVETVQDYAITYYRPEQDGMNVEWSDNQGNKGTIDYNEFHTQPSYYPRWVKEDSYTLRGALLKSRTEQREGIWYNGRFEWGYADNFSSVDRLTGQVKVNANHFKISDAVKYDGSPADLKYIDFVKIQTGVNVKAGIVGEVSTEVLLVNDFNILK